jgi:hypothetical protein
MTIDQIVHATAGSVVLASIALGALVHPYWLALGAMVGINLLQSAFTSFCPLATVLKNMGVPERASGC